MSLSAGVNLFLNDLVYNKRLSFKLEPLSLVEVDSENLPSEVKQSLEEVEQMDESEFVYFSFESDED